jgi:CsoR family transcriptional regulator, copper-sensing transcriptional repressor
MAETSKEEIIKRLNRIKGQVEGILRMVDRPKHAVEIFHQITAAKKALDSTGRLLLEKYIQSNISGISKSKEDTQKIKDILEIIEKF